MLSKRGAVSAASQDIPWRFAPGWANKYDPVSNPSGVISFGMAENLLVQKELASYSRHIKLDPVDFCYRGSNGGGPRFPTAMAGHINDYFQPHTPVLPEHIVTAASLTSIHKLIGLSLGDAGDGILVSRPMYGRFELDFGNTAGLKIVYADMKGIDPFDEKMVGRYQEKLDEAQAAGMSIKALMIVNPHNPLGRCYTKTVSIALMRFCQKNAIHFISDEVYALSVYDESEEVVPFTSVLSIDTSEIIDPNLLHVFYGMSKDFGAPGLRIGCLITRNAELRKAVAANLRFHGVSGPSLVIATAILEDKPFVKYFLRLCRQRIQEARAYTVAALEGGGIQYQHGSNAGFFLYVDLSPWLSQSTPGQGINDRDFELAQRLLDGGVGLHPCEEHNDEPGHFRLVFTLERSDLEEGLKRLLDTLKAIPTKQMTMDL